MLMQVMSLAADHIIKVWDLRTQGCLQTIAPSDWPVAEDAHPSALMYDGGRKRLISIKHRPAAWPHKCVSDQSSAHQSPLVGALLNTTFDVVSPMPLLLILPSLCGEMFPLLLDTGFAMNGSLTNSIVSSHKAPSGSQ